jgi:hypothetical protein
MRLREKADSIAYEMASDYIFNEIREYFEKEGQFDGRGFDEGREELKEILGFLGGVDADMQFKLEEYDTMVLKYVSEIEEKNNG